MECSLLVNQSLYSDNVLAGMALTASAVTVLVALSRSATRSAVCGGRLRAEKQAKMRPSTIVVTSGAGDDVLFIFG